MQYIGEDKVKYVIAISPFKRRGARERNKEKPDAYPFLGLKVIGKTAVFSREIYVWHNWDMADAKIDVDASGFFEFDPQMVREMIQRGYDGAWKEVYHIKTDLALMEDSARLFGTDETIDTLKAIKGIHRLSSITIYSLKGDPEFVLDEAALEDNFGEHMGAPIERMESGEEKNRILKAIRYIEGSHLEREDICDALKRIYHLGDFEHVIARIEEEGKGWALTFFVKPKRTYSSPVTVLAEIEPSGTIDAHTLTEVSGIIRESIQDAIADRKRSLSFNETERIVKSNLVDHGFVRPRVFSAEMEHDTLSISGNMGTRIDGIRLRGNFSPAKRSKIRKEFKKPYNPRSMLKGTKYALKEYQLGYAYVEGIDADSLIVAAAKKPNTTLEYPSLALEGFEGINSFGELRVRSWHVMNMFSTSPYVRYSFNYVMKDAEELPRGQIFGAGLEKCSNRFLDFPEIRAYWRYIKCPSVPGSSDYDMEFQEKNGQVTYPFYMGNWAIIPGFEISKFKTNGAWSEINQEAIFWLRYDVLDRAVFPESGLKFDIDTKFGLEPQRWSRARVRLLWVPMRVKLQQKVTTTLTFRLFYSKFFKNPPQHERYSLGGISPVGSYCMRLYDAEDLPGYRKDEFLEPEMWKGLITWRFALMEMAPMGLRFNIQMESFMYLAGAGEQASINNRLEECPGFGLYFDTSYFNIGLIALFHKEGYRQGEERSLEHLINHFYFSAVYYGFAL